MSIDIIQYYTDFVISKDMTNFSGHTPERRLITLKVRHNQCVELGIGEEVKPWFCTLLNSLEIVITCLIIYLLRYLHV